MLNDKVATMRQLARNKSLLLSKQITVEDYKLILEQALVGLQMQPAFDNYFSAVDAILGKEKSFVEAESKKANTNNVKK